MPGRPNCEPVEHWRSQDIEQNLEFIGEASFYNGASSMVYEYYCKLLICTCVIICAIRLEAIASRSEATLLLVARMLLVVRPGACSTSSCS